MFKIDRTVAWRFLRKLGFVVILAILTWFICEALFDDFDPDMRRQAFREARSERQMKAKTTTEDPSEHEYTPDSFYFPPADSFPD